MNKLIIAVFLLVGCEPSNQPMEQPVKVGIVEKVDITANYGKYIIVITDDKRELLYWPTVFNIEEAWAKAKVGEKLEYSVP